MISQPLYVVLNFYLFISLTQSQDFVSFDLQSSMLQNVRTWISQPGAFDEAMKALLSATGDPSIFQLDNFDPSTLISDPLDEIEVSMGQTIPYSFDSAFTPDFSGFDLSGSSTIGSQSPTDDITEYASFSGDADHSSLDHESYNADDFINFDGILTLPPILSPVDMPTTSQRLDQMSGALQPTPYAPPAGASHSSTRRVAGSWKPSFVVTDSPIDVSPPRSWGISAT
jgi:hypothetical protein